MKRTRAVLLLTLALALLPGALAAQNVCGRSGIDLTSPAQVAQAAQLKIGPYRQPPNTGPGSDGGCWVYGGDSNYHYGDACYTSSQACESSCLSTEQGCVSGCYFACGNTSGTNGSCFENCGDRCRIQYSSCHNSCS